MARGAKRPQAPLPPPLPPETRTVGQVVAETINLYRRNFWASLALGLGPAAATVGVTLIGGWWALVFVLTAFSLLMTASYVGAIAIAAEKPTDRRSLLVAIAVGYVVYLPAPFLYGLFVLPAVAWLALVGLAVPAAFIERLDYRRAVRRGFELARADYAHAAGSLATLVIVAFLTSTVLFFLLRGASQVERSAAAFLSLLVISPILFLGAALLYYDQAARVRTRRIDADVHHAVDADRPGRADAEGEPRAAARGES